MHDLARWADHLEHLARSGGVRDPAEWPPSCALRPGRRDHASDPTGPGGEVLLWRALEAGDGFGASGLDLVATGSLWRRDDWSSVEVWTEAELAGLHALTRVERLRPWEATAFRARRAAAVDWHLEHTQPDNATNRPWACHVFLLAGSPEARCYAETLVHNAQVHGLRDPASAWILGDSARELRLALA